MSFSNALQLHSVLLASKRKQGMPPPFEHPRFFAVEAEEHHLVWGPKKKEAALVGGGRGPSWEALRPGGS